MSKVPTRVPALRHPVPTSSYSQVPYRPAQKSTVPTMHVPPMTGRFVLSFYGFVISNSGRDNIIIRLTEVTNLQLHKIRVE